MLYITKTVLIYACDMHTCARYPSSFLTAVRLNPSKHLNPMLKVHSTHKFTSEILLGVRL